MSEGEIKFSPPSLKNRVLEGLRVREITPSDICPNPEDQGRLYEKYPSLYGDKDAIGPGDDGDCQDWRGDYGWWREYVSRKKEPKRG